MPVDYATAFGIKSFAAPIAFAALYTLLFTFYTAKTIAHPSYIFFILAFFCAVRISAFILRALFSHDPSVAGDLDAIIAYEIIYNIGFFGLLYSAYLLVTDRVALAKNPPNGFISRLLRRRFLFRIALAVAVALGITGAVQSSPGSQPSTITNGNTLRRIAIYIFLVCSILVLLQTYFLARTEFQDGSYHASTKIGATYGVYILLLISTLLVAREAFFTATAHNLSQQNNEALWYPLSAVTEFIAVILFAVPGLVPEPNP